MSYRTISSETAFHGRALTLRIDWVRLPDGRETRLEIIDHPGSVAIIPVDEEGRIWFVRQYRHAAREELLELPAGTRKNGEIPADCAQRELREEIGLGAGEMTPIGGFYLAPGYSSEFMHIFLATGLFKDRLPGDEDEIIFPERRSRSEVESLLELGAFRDAKTVAALGVYLSST